MLYAGAVLIEGIALWLLAQGVSGWTVAVVAVAGVVMLLVLDRALDRGGPEQPRHRP